MKREHLISAVKQALLCMQRFPWEHGVSSQAMLESGDLKLAFYFARESVSRQADDGRLSAVFFKDHVAMFGDEKTAADSAANGENVLYFAEKDDNKAFLEAAYRQRDWLLHKAPRANNGAISHMIPAVQVWVDAMFMCIPFLARIGEQDEAVRQVRAMRELLKDEQTKLFYHVWDDEKQYYASDEFWGVGNGWALMGMAKTVRFLSCDREDRKEIISYIKELLDAMLSFQDASGLFHNHINEPETFLDTNCSQMAAYVIYSGVKEGWLEEKYVPIADKIREIVASKVDELGFVQGVCGSPTFRQQGIAVEGQACFILMEAAAEKYRAQN